MFLGSMRKLICLETGRRIIRMEIKEERYSKKDGKKYHHLAVKHDFSGYNRTKQARRSKKMHKKYYKITKFRKINESQTRW